MTPEEVDENRDLCSCETFTKARHELYDGIWRDKGEWMMSDYLPPLKFCPWCGKKAPNL
jgi:hypothetical protein